MFAHVDSVQCPHSPCLSLSPKISHNAIGLCCLCVCVGRSVQAFAKRSMNPFLPRKKISHNAIGTQSFFARRRQPARPLINIPEKNFPSCTRDLLFACIGSSISLFPPTTLHLFYKCSCILTNKFFPPPLPQMPVQRSSPPSKRRRSVCSLFLLFGTM